MILLQDENIRNSFAIFDDLGWKNILHSTTKPTDISCMLWMNEMQNPNLQNPPDVRNSTTIINTMQLYHTCVQQTAVCVRMSIPYITKLMMAIKLEKN